MVLQQVDGDAELALDDAAKRFIDGFGAETVRCRNNCTEDCGDGDASNGRSDDDFD